MTGYRLGVDVGGTFTDLVLLAPDGRALAWKVLSTAPNYADGILVMQSNGGIMTSAGARGRPVHVIESGPAAGVIATAALARRLGAPNVISIDMGGTTAKASVIEGGEIKRAGEYEIGGSMSQGSRLNRGGGYLLRVPAIDIAEVGAGGGSIVTVDVAGALHVGPESAGAVPGPVCYDQGGTAVTLTDANVCLGYLHPERLPSGLTLAAVEARRAVGEQVAAPLGLPFLEAAHGIYLLGCAGMARAVRAVSIERGRDPLKASMARVGAEGAREAYFGPAHGLCPTPVIGRLDLDRAPRPGPLLVDEYDATTLVPPGCRTWRDEWENIVITTEG